MADFIVIEDNQQPLLLLEGSNDVLVFDNAPVLSAETAISGSLLLIDAPTPQTTVVAPPADFMLIDGAHETVAEYNNAGVDFVVIQSGGPMGLQGIQGPAGPEAIGAITTHINALLPHPVYDDIQSLVLLFENGIV